MRHELQTEPRLADARIECARCGRPDVACYCASITRIDTRTRIVVLQHPREHEKPVNTARIAALALSSASLVVGVDFSDSRELLEALSDPSRPAVLLYPGPEVRDLQVAPPAGPVTLIVLDGTWHQARVLLRRNLRIAALPRYALTPGAPSEYRIRRQPRPGYVSTIEALAAALAVLEGDRPRFEPLLTPFRAMVEVQVGYASRSTGGRKRSGRRNGTDARARLPALLREPRLVCATGEANAWPCDRASGRPRHPHELVHWLAVRLDSGACQETILAPRGPLASSPVTRSRIPLAALRAGVSVAQLLHDFAAFSDERDVVCVWGSYASELFVRERGTPFARLVDLRKVAGDFLQRRPGAIESLVAERALPWQPLGTGRGGERLGMLAAVTRWLAYQAHSTLPSTGRALTASAG